MSLYDGPLFDADNHYYEAHDAFIRHVPKHMHRRCVQWVEMENGKKFHLVGGKLDRQTPNPTFNPISKPGVLRQLYRGNPGGKSGIELVRSALEPMPPEYMDRDARLLRMDEQGLEAVWLFPTEGVLYEEPLKDDIQAVCALFQGFNRWLDEDWGLNYQNRIFSAPYFSLADVDWACRELEWALERDARVIVMRPAAAWTRFGPLNPADPEFDPFWARVNEAGICVVAHVANSGYSTNGYAGKGLLDSLGIGLQPTIAGFGPERAIYDFLISLAYDKLFERFPNLRIASVENGSGYLGDLFRKLDQSKRRMPHWYKEDPSDLFRAHVWINPFWEDDLSAIADQMGADRVIFGSDWPHMEGLEKPRDIFEELGGISPQDQAKILHTNAASLNQRLVA